MIRAENECTSNVAMVLLVSVQKNAMLLKIHHSPVRVVTKQHASHKHSDRYQFDEKLNFTTFLLLSSLSTHITIPSNARKKKSRYYHQQQHRHHHRHQHEQHLYLMQQL